jgi:hypothetical protein
MLLPHLFLMAQPSQPSDGFSDDFIDFSPFDDLLFQEITGQDKYNNIIKNSTNSILIITADEIKKLGFTTLKEVINYATDYYFSFDGT